MLKCTERMFWEDLAEAPAQEIFNFHLQENFDSILSEAGGTNPVPPAQNNTDSMAQAHTCAHTKKLLTTV